MLTLLRYFFLVLLALILLGLFNGLVFLPVLLVIVGPPAQVVADDNAESLPPTTPLPSPVRYKAKPPKIKTSNRSSHDNNAFTSVKTHHRRHNSDISLSTIAEETNSASSVAESNSVSSCEDQEAYNGTSVFIEPHITVETSTLPAVVSVSVLMSASGTNFYLHCRDPAQDHPGAPLPLREQARSPRSQPPPSSRWSSTLPWRAPADPRPGGVGEAVPAARVESPQCRVLWSCLVTA